ncbi:hypothetical protein [Motiliproteus sediminis]|uniref:hypothetical protein n=1 Tax=Motiliproteus sediminis TaxID=1468178 RepID=UPI001AEF5DCC|nr:hypothetical protein [Motiliproteus sediminis]
MITITESGVDFGPFEEESVFRVEKSPSVTSLKGIKTCEFAWWRNDGNQLAFIEAKSSIPNSRRSPDEFEEYFISMLEKFDNSLQVLLIGTQGRRDKLSAELGNEIAVLNWQQAQILFYLVIPAVPKEYLSPLTDKLRTTLSRQLTIWQANAFVINEQMAREKGLLVEAA